MADLIAEARPEDEHRILAGSGRAAERTQVLKDEDTFAVFAVDGDFRTTGPRHHGLYHNGTRYLSQLELRLNGQRPLLLSSVTRDDSHAFTADLSNPDMLSNGAILLQRDVVHVFRSRFLWRGCCYERLRLTNYGLETVSLHLSFTFAADFADIFEVRGTSRVHRGQLLPSEVGPQRVELAYKGLDGRRRTTRLSWDCDTHELYENNAVFRAVVAAQQSFTLGLTIECVEGDRHKPQPADEAFEALITRDEEQRQRYARIETSDARFNDWLVRSASDLRMMTTHLPEGSYPYAGVPWFNTVFGRDGLITALSLLWVNPTIAEGVLGHLAATQASAIVAEQDAEPGKILHEARSGEMAALGEVPFGRYYGSVDATPLFVMLAGAYFRRTGNLDLVERIWPNIERALDWIARYGDQDGDGLVEYARRSEHGLVHQGWKDSQDSVFHADGRLAAAPIALCEVQAYVYGAWCAAAELADELDRHDMARQFRQSGEKLRERFEELFWCEDLGMYALALDGDKQPCRVRTSNAGQCLLTGIASPERARRITETLGGANIFSGWGIRTVSASELRYNPMSYHNGSIWPHDNALIAAGCARYGHTDIATRILSALFDASMSFELHRLAELFCGFHRRASEPPISYPVACAPQAWSAAAVFLLLQACLGISIDARARRVTIAHAKLPLPLERVIVNGLQIDGTTSVDLQFDGLDDEARVKVTRRLGSVKVTVLK